MTSNHFFLKLKMQYEYKSVACMAIVLFPSFVMNVIWTSNSKVFFPKHPSARLSEYKCICPINALKSRNKKEWLGWYNFTSGTIFT